ncbi:MAG: helix-turn-helix transcriptional regulator [Chloroflexi bacterium]|nr:helix-turn-helix transcriptional regulator [Chloroflexota bacterium]
MKKKNSVTMEFQLDVLLKERDISIRKLALISGIHYKTALNIYHNHTAGIALDVLAKICKALDVTPDKIFKFIK